MDGELFGVAVAATYENAQRNGLTWRLTPGTVTSSAISGATVTNVPVLLDGDNVALIRAQSLIGAVPNGTRVMVMTVPPQGNYIVGTYGPGLTGFVDETVRTTSVGPFTTTETLLDQISFDASANLRYKLTWVGTVQSTVANDLIRLKMRYDTTSTLTSAGTEFTSREINADVAAKGMPITIVKTVVPGLSGPLSIGVLAVRSSGTGNISSFADATRNISMLLEVY